MPEKEPHIKDLKNYKYDYQYYREKFKDVENLKQDVSLSLSRLNDMKIKKYDTTELDSKIKKLLEKQSLEEDALIKIMTKKQEIENRIENMPQPYKNILFLKYIRDNTFDEIASKMSYSNKRIYQLHKEALDIYLEQFKSLA